MIYGQPICKSASVHDKDSAETNVRIAILNKQNPAMWTGRMHDSSANPTHALDNKNVLVTVGQDMIHIYSYLMGPYTYDT